MVEMRITEKNRTNDKFLERKYLKELM